MTSRLVRHGRYDLSSTAVLASPAPAATRLLLAPAGVAVHKVTTEFMLSGSLGDYDAAAQTAIKTALANAAEVTPPPPLTAGSVIVTAIFFGTTMPPLPSPECRQHLLGDGSGPRSPSTPVCIGLGMRQSRFAEHSMFWWPQAPPPPAADATFPSSRRRWGRRLRLVVLIVLVLFKRPSKGDR